MGNLSLGLFDEINFTLVVLPSHQRSPIISEVTPSHESSPFTSESSLQIRGLSSHQMNPITTGTAEGRRWKEVWRKWTSMYY